jgi:aryl-alcohol dehydrogenase-like predicted oxidoreductase
MDALPLSPARRPLGRSALAAFPIAWGGWRLVGEDASRARALVEAALAAGIELFDLADVYGLDHGGRGFGESEALFGRVLADAPHLRGRMLIATKGGIVPTVPYDASAAHLRAACEASLRRLRVDVIDLYQIHRPDWLAHPEETAGALARLREQGKVREVGVSNHGAAQFAALQRFLDFPIATHQPEWSCLTLRPLEDGVVDQCLRERVAPLAWSPLAGGRLALAPEAARRAPDGGRLAAVIDRLDALAAREGVPRAAVALAWLLVHPAGAIPIVGTQRPERIAECLRAFDVRLSRRDWYALVEASRGEPLP